MNSAFSKFLLGIAVATVACILALNSFAQESPSQGPAPTFPPAPIKAAPSSSKPAALVDLAWLQGQWNGTWGQRTATQVWSAPRAGMMLGTLQIVDGTKTLVIELVTVVQMPTGVQYRLLRFTPSLVPWDQSGPATLSLASDDPKRFVFQNQADSEPQQIVLTRLDADSYVDSSEIAHKTGDALTWDITFHRQKSNAGNASHP